MADDGAFRAAIEDYIRREALPAEKFGHQPRLYSLARRIGSALSYDDDVLFAAAWLHDLGVFTGHRPEDLIALAKWDNVRYAMERAPSVLAGMGFPSEKIPAVVEAIRTHQPAEEPLAIEGILLRDADILEQLGAIGIMRTVCKIGRDTRFQDFTSAAASLRAALAGLPARIRLDRTRELATPRIELLQTFLAALDAESSVGLF